MELFTKRPFLAKTERVQYKRKSLLTSVSGVAYMPLRASELARVVEVKLETNRNEENVKRPFLCCLVQEPFSNATRSSNYF